MAKLFLTRSTLTSFAKNSFQLLGLCCLPLLANSETILVHGANELQTALKNAKAGQEIVLQPGYTYVGNTNTSGSQSKGAHFYASANGTASKPIILRSQSRNNQQTLSGNDIHSNYTFYLTGNYWIVQDLIFTGAQKGIVLDGASHNVLDNIRVHSIGEEAIHLRDTSPNNVVKNCLVTDTGLTGRLGYGEGVYIGSDTSLIPNDLSVNNTVGGCQIGPNVSGENIDIKEATTGTVIEFNTFDGSGIPGEEHHYADSFVDIKGDEAIIRNNTMDDKGNPKVLHGIHALRGKDHRHSYIYDNTVTMNKSLPFIKVGEGITHVKNNTFTKGINTLVTDYRDGAYDTVIRSGLKPKGSYTGYLTTPRSSGVSLPEKLEAEHYSAAPNDSTAGNQNNGAITKCTYKGMNVDVQDANEGSCSIGWTTPGEELIYTIGNGGGTYDVTLRAASKYAGKRIALYVNGNKVGQTATTGTDWQQFENLKITNVAIPNNSQLSVVFVDGSANLNYIDIKTPSNDNAIQIDATDYSYAPDVQLVSNNTAVGYFDAGDQIQYANINFNGLNSITLEYAARWSGREIEIRRNWLNGPLLATVVLPSTGDWSNYETLNVPLSNSTGTNKLVIKGKTGNSIANLKTLTLNH